MAGKPDKMKNILLIDDDPAIFHTIKIVLDSPEYNVVYFDNIASASRHINAGNKIDLIILDLIIPFQSGFEFLDMLKDMKSKTPLIVISAIDNAKAAAEAMKKGASDYITKPFSLQDIKEVIFKFLKK